jgi:hypothetical protein
MSSISLAPEAQIEPIAFAIAAEERDPPPLGVVRLGLRCEPLKLGEPKLVRPVLGDRALNI